jgi:hypothetical protein
MWLLLLELLLYSHRVVTVMDDWAAASRQQAHSTGAGTLTVVEVLLGTLACKLADGNTGRHVIAVKEMIPDAAHAEPASIQSSPSICSQGGGCQWPGAEARRTAAQCIDSNA